jgi:hypothetical protein
MPLQPHKQANPIPHFECDTDGTVKVLKRAVLNGSTSGADVVPAVAGKRIKVFAYALQATGTVTMKLRDGASGADLTLTWDFQAREGVASHTVKPPTYLFATSAGLALQVVLSGVVTSGVEVSYWDSDET